jgi:hypothetical protein
MRICRAILLGSGLAGTLAMAAAPAWAGSWDHDGWHHHHHWWHPGWAPPPPVYYVPPPPVYLRASGGDGGVRYPLTFRGQYIGDSA